MSNHFNPNGSLNVVRWAEVENGALHIGTHPRPLQMMDSDGTAEPILTDGRFGCDVIRFPAGGGVKPHVHEGDHILLALAGEGFVIVAHRSYRLTPGCAYLIEGSLPHAIEAETDLVLMAIGNRHQPADSRERMALQEFPNVAL